MQQLNVYDPTPRPKMGLKKEHKIINCSACSRPLLKLLLTMPDLDVTMDVVANCPYCGDKSFVETIQGDFRPAGYFEEKPDDTEDVVPYTEIIDIDADFDKNITFFKLRACNG